MGFIISAISKLTTAVFYISTMPETETINMTNKYSYELMYNLFNGYFVSFEELINIILKDFRKNAQKQGIINIIIICISLSMSIVFVVIFWKMMSKLDNDREKPINLFLTIKKKVFESLKNSAESFSNKLLNKFFGNEDNEEESQQEYISNVKPNDINIAKYKALNEYTASINNKSSFFFYFVQLILMSIILCLYTLLKYINATFYFKNTYNFSVVYNETQFSQIYLMSKINVIKQYFYNDTITNFNFPESTIDMVFAYVFIQMSDQLGEMMIYSSKMSSFLKNLYKNEFKKYFYSDFSELIKLDDINNNNFYYISNKTNNGFKQINIEIYEILRFFTIQYYINSNRDQNHISELVFDEEWTNLDKLIVDYVRPWYNNMFNILDSCFVSYVENIEVMYIIVYITFIVLTSFYYWIIWKKYEDNFISLIKKSFDLINLIPEEIKNIIVIKLNER